jgi:3-dehydroquinate dehydratase/shikimate dehydrogenase
MSRALLCETVTGDTHADLVAARDRAVIGDMVEVRLDGVRDLDVAAALAGRTKPVVVTCRAAFEGGRFDGSEDERRAILGRALDLGAEFVDIEWQAGFADLVARDPARVVLSSHSFDGMPADLADRVRAMRAVGARTIKVAVATPRLRDLQRLAAIGAEGNAIVIGMGETGVPSRLLASRFGSPWTYAGNGVAPGQIPAVTMIDTFRFRDVGPDTRIFGVVSGTAMHSLSPVMHNRAFAEAGIDAVYVPFQTDDFDDFLAFAQALNVEGASITIPFKLDALRAADRCEGVATEVGAANTLRRGAAGWEATNTDVDGFLAPLRAVIDEDPSGMRASVLGAGGSARAVAAGLRSLGMVVTLHARRAAQAREVASTLGCVAGAWPPQPYSWDVLVNTTPLGGAGKRDESPLPDGPFEGLLVYDLTYGPGESKLLRDAREQGCRVLDGLPMLAAQAERQFTWWTGRNPRKGAMESAARRALGDRGRETGNRT